MAADTYRRWAAGLCPCCGAELDWWRDIEPQAIGEGVMVCGRCVDNEHGIRPEEAEMRDAMLEAIARRDDGPIERLLAGTT